MVAALFQMMTELQKPVALSEEIVEKDDKQEEEEEKGGRVGVMVNGLEPSEDASWIAEDTTDPVGVVSGWSQSEHVVRREENPAFFRPPSHALSPSLFQHRMKPSAAASSVLRSRPLLTSTPQLSPVCEADERSHPHHDNQADESDFRSRYGNQVTYRVPQQPERLESIPEQSPFHSATSVFHAAPSASVAPDTVDHRWVGVCVSSLSFPRSKRNFPISNCFEPFERSISPSEKGFWKAEYFLPSSFPNLIL